MYAKSIIEYVGSRAVAGAWSRHLTFVPVAMALVVAALPFTLKPHFATPAQPAAARAEPAASMESPFAGLVQASVASSPKRTALPLDKQQRAVVGYVTRKYGVSTEVVQELVKTAFTAGKQFGVDPLLVVAMMAVESSFNPIAESYAGAKGLMQIIPKYHPEKFEVFGGEQTVFDPRVNIMVGARIVREYLLMHSGDLFTALQTYAGAMADRDSIYTNRVLNEKDQLDALAGFPKTERKSRIVMQVEPQQPGKPMAVPKPLVLSPESPMNPAASSGTPQASTKPSEEAAQHTPPTQPAPQAPAAVNVTLLQQPAPAAAQRF